MAGLLQQLDDPDPDTGTYLARLRRALRLMEQQRTELLICDEIQHLIDSDTHKIDYRTADILKTIANARVCSLLAVGLPHASRVLMSNEQIDERCFPTITIEPFDWFLEEEREEFRVILMAWEEALDLPEPSHLGRMPMARRIAYFCRGRIGRAHRLIRLAYVRNRMRSEPSRFLDLALLAETADAMDIHKSPKPLNPFRVDPPKHWEPALAQDPVQDGRRPGKRRQPDADPFA
ncbi:TniB family NTP-binding protein [Siccirubricoccus sp. KC 17139]|uniref:TniB family NTP-binding protein n=1 Tax=Siccirubricoccus soli TaxID=2899147 RepID=A0ABT1D3K0_9PROT|nr:TniB family NTP-binding protein [Siccirubricoccus soli]MCP2681916.1 TniB family NTP-binding protein [Siccirubricoccus soli]